MVVDDPAICCRFEPSHINCSLACGPPTKTGMLSVFIQQEILAAEPAGTRTYCDALQYADWPTSFIAPVPKCTGEEATGPPRVSVQLVLPFSKAGLSRMLSLLLGSVIDTCLMSVPLCEGTA